MIASVYIITLSFLAGNLVVHCLPVLPPNLVLVAGIATLAGFVPKRWVPAYCLHGMRIGAAFIAGFCWTLLVANLHQDDILAAGLENRVQKFQGQVISIPKRGDGRVSFIFKPDRDAKPRLPQKIYFKLYNDDDQVKLKSRLEVMAKLKPPYGYANPGGFDYEKWLFMNRVGANAYALNYRIIPRTDGSTGIDDLRQWLNDRLASHRHAVPHVDSIAALGLGFSRALSPAQNDLLVATGTRHLFAVSGLHINLVFAFFFLIIQWLWSRLLLAKTQYPAASAALLGALPLAACYAFLAGFSLPTQRALIMLSCFVVGWHCKRRLPSGQLLALALLLVLAYDPLSTLSASLWLSFGAVALIAFYLLAYPSQSGWRKWCGLQVYLSLATAALTMLFFSRGSLIAPIANLFVVPLVGFLMLPACLLALAALATDGWLAQVTLTAVGWFFSIFWTALEWLAAFGAEWFWRPSWWVFALALGGILLFAFLPDWRNKCFALLLLLPLFNNHAVEWPAVGAVKIDFLDVGQGLSVVVRTQRHVLLYDTGPYFASGFNTGDTVVIPYLRSLGINKLDTLIVSHNDNDHAGSALPILKKLKVKRILSGEETALGGQPAQRCRRGEHWTWDGVRFEILHPGEGREWRGNNASCVLKISNASHRVLLTADVEASAERVVGRPDAASDVMLVPHHGSNTSSTPAFIEAVSPRLAIITADYLNQYGFPAAGVVQRYTRRGIEVRNTATDGMLSLDLPPDAPMRLVAYRHAARKYWRHSGSAKF